ncbi:MAG: sulfatase-like hydrolase/transferase [Bacteroidetes bacterium]|nr:sulfatase-like hydrolase/transferase [Bacteroidota bacterium]MBS1648921.1 sulfatase-like hydrolase/transferase [Bacteroidota bacterium]
MQKKIKNILAKPIYVYLLGVFFIVYRTMQFPKAFDILIFSAVLVGYLIVVFLLLFLFKKVKHIHYWVFCLMLFSLFAQEIATLFFSIIKLIRLDRFRYVIILYPLTCLLLFIIKIKFFKGIKFEIGLNIFLIIVIVTNIINGFIVERKEWQHLSINQSKNIQLVKSEKPDDIIWILLDEYASTSYLSNQLHFHNSFPEVLKNKGFYTVDSMPSRFDLTLFSINSIFNLDDSILHSTFGYARNALINNIYYNELKKQNYNFINYEFLGFPIKSEVESNFNPVFPKNYKEQIFFNSLISIIQMKLFNYQINSYNTQIVPAALKKINTQQNQKRFFWVHALMPHPPFFKDSLGNNIERVYNDNISNKKNIDSLYCNYLAYANKVVLKFLDSIKDWQHKTIIISGDHGYRVGLKTNNPYRFATFAAIYYPKMDTVDLKKIKYLQQIPLHLKY